MITMQFVYGIFAGAMLTCLAALLFVWYCVWEERAEQRKKQERKDKITYLESLERQQEGYDYAAMTAERFQKTYPGPMGREMVVDALALKIEGVDNKFNSGISMYLNGKERPK